MNTKKGNDKFDKDIEALYAQRKNSIQTPEITFAETALKKTYRVKSIFSVLALGGVASFGILAVISHFAYLPIEEPLPPVEAMAFVSTIEIERFNADSQSINMQPPEQLARENKILAAQPTRNFEAMTNIEIKPKAAEAITLDSSKLKTIALMPNTLKPNDIQPTLKVMPTLTRALTLHKSGKVKLTYTISEEGKVQNIKVVQSNVHQALERSAKKALSQWRYAQQPDNNEALQVEFQFVNGQ